MYFKKLLEELDAVLTEVPLNDPDYEKQRREEINKTKHKRTETSDSITEELDKSIYKVVATYKTSGGIHQVVRNDKHLYRLRLYVNNGKAQFTSKPMTQLPTALNSLFRRFPQAELVKKENKE